MAIPLIYLVGGALFLLTQKKEDKKEVILEDKKDDDIKNITKPLSDNHNYTQNMINYYSGDGSYWDWRNHQLKSLSLPDIKKRIWEEVKFNHGDTLEGSIEDYTWFTEFLNTFTSMKKEDNSDKIEDGYLEDLGQNSGIPGAGYVGKGLDWFGNWTGWF